MSIAMAYMTVIIVWTTTPLGVTWSSETVDPTLSALVRMLLAAMIGWCILRAMGRSLCWSGAAIKKYLYANIGITAALYATYHAAGLIPSGLISVIYGLSPMLSGVFARWLLKDQSMPLFRWIASLIALIGLWVIFGVDISNDQQAMMGIGLLLFAVTLFSLSGVLLKKSAHKNSHLEQTVGSLIVSVPLFVVAFLIENLQVLLVMDSAEVVTLIVEKAQQIEFRSVGAIVYLAVMGSLVGFVCYFYILSALSPSTVALVTLVTPVLALILGVWLNNEVISPETWIGTGFIIGALALFNWGDRIRSFHWNALMNKTKSLRVEGVMKKKPV